MITGMARLGSAAHSVRRVDLHDFEAGLLQRVDRAALACAAVLVVERADHDRLVAGLEPEAAERLVAERAALRLLLGADIAAAELRDDLRHRHVLVHHLDAGLGGLLGERHDRRVARMAHHGDAVGLARRPPRAAAGPSSPTSQPEKT